MRTTADGRFEIANIEEGRYSIIATAPGLVSDAAAIDVTSAPAQLDIKMRVSALNETLVVSAAQIDQPLSRTPDSVTVIAGREIEAKQQFTLSSALRSVPGLTIQQNGGPGTVTSLFTRGGESDYTLVMVDGVRANAFGGGLDLSQVPLEDVERIEVVRGSQSALYGSDAIAGVVQVITTSGGTPTARAQIETGSRDMLRYAGATSGEHQGVRWQFGANHYEDAGFTGTAANGQTVRTTIRKNSRSTGRLAGVMRRAALMSRGRSSMSTPTAARRARTDRIPRTAMRGVDTVSRGTTKRVGGGVRWVQPWFGPSSRVRQRVEFDEADYDLEFLSQFGTSESNSHRSHARVQTDVAASSAIRILRRGRVAR